MQSNNPAAVPARRRSRVPGLQPDGTLRVCYSPGVATQAECEHVERRVQEILLRAGIRPGGGCDNPAPADDPQRMLLEGRATSLPPRPRGPRAASEAARG